uniref:Uncharacterized protein n=1 Tax=Globisporangium ultimum (strain ATCC 200006 / CBS 805.95 / DAOM BR144) TaxID=431595 RepID=K3XD09_GLOUD
MLVTRRGRRAFMRAMQQQRLVPRAFSSSSPSSGSSPQPPSPRHWSGINTYYFSLRGLGIATRVVSNMQDFFRFYDNGVFAKSINDDARSAMYVLTQFPASTRVDLIEFKQAAEQVVHTVYEQMYAASNSKQTIPKAQEEALDSNATVGADAPTDPLWYLSSIASDSCAEVLKSKAAMQTKRLALKGASPRTTRVILEQLNVNRVEIAAVEYKSRRYGDEDAQQRGYDEEEWLEVHVQYDVTEHLQITTTNGEGIDDRKTINTTFTWTFESNVTDPDEVDWQIVDTTPFTETSAVLTPIKAAEK